MRQPVLVGANVQPMASYGFKPALIHSASLPANQQLVPYNPAQVAQMYPHLAPQEKKPLTPDELQRLYSLNQVPSYSFAAAPLGATPLSMPQQRFSTPTAPLSVATMGQTPYYASYSMPYGSQIAPPTLPQVSTQPQSAYTAMYPQLNMQVASIATAQPGASTIDAGAPKLPPRSSLTGIYQPAPAIPPRGSSPSNISTTSIPHSNSTGQVNKFTEEVQLRRRFKEHKNPSGDLIDLSNGNDEYV